MARLIRDFQPTIQALNRTQPRANAQAGFTLLELVVTIAVLSLLSALTIPSGLGLIETLQLRTSSDRVYRLMREAQSNAVRDNMTWQVSFRQGSDQLQGSIHPAIPDTFIPPSIHWQDLGNADLDIAETTIDCSQKICSAPNNVWRTQFNHKANTNGQLGRVTLMSRSNPKLKRCIILSTLIGGIRIGRVQSKPDDAQRYCY